MGFIQDANRFKAVQDKLQEAHANRSSGGNARENQISMKAGNTYKFRLLSYIPEDAERELPFLTKYKHLLKDEDSGKWHGVTCPTTYHPKTGFDKCPLCANNRQLWNSELDSDKELYKRFKRKFDGYALVYVINDPSNEENNGTVKIFRYGIGIHNFLQKEIFGISKTGEDVSDAIGFDAFNLEKGADLIIEVTKKGDWNDYACKFARKMTAIQVDMDELVAGCETCNIESEVRATSDADLADFYKRWVLCDSAEDGDINISGSAPAPTPKPVKAEEEISDDVNNLLADLDAEANEGDPVVPTSDDEMSLDDIESLINS
jgi:hypothetical protein